MADVAENEFTDLDEKQKEAMRIYRDASIESSEFCRPYFDKFVRFIELYHGVMPAELDCTFSKVMLNLAFSMVQNELPRSASTLFSEDEFFDITANAPELEYATDPVKEWLLYTARTRNRIYPRILDTLTNVGIMGTSYRAVTHRPVQRPRNALTGGDASYTNPVDGVDIVPTIVAQNLDPFSVQPSPNGSEANNLDPHSENAVEYILWVDYKTESSIKALSDKGFIDKTQAGRMLSSDEKGDENALDSEYKEIIDSNLEHNSTPNFMEHRRNNRGGGLGKWYRVVWYFGRDKWMLIGEGRYPLYNGPPLLEWIPIAKYQDTPAPGQWFGHGMIEVTEDVILAYLLNFNLRMDSLVTRLHPTKYVRDDILRANNMTAENFDPGPYSVVAFPQRVQNIQHAIWHDRFPEVAPEAFVEETNFRQLLQEITAQPNYMKGQGGAGTLANETATGIVSLIEEGTARSSLRSLNMEYIGLQDELMLMLKWARKYVFEDEYVRIKGRNGWPWVLVPHHLLHEDWGLELRGTRSLVHKNEMVKRMLSIMPMLLNNPNVPGQRELLEEALQKLGAFGNLDKILGPKASLENFALQGIESDAPGVGGTPTLQNDTQALAGALPAGAPAQTPANFAV
ncbi:hypothetical protein CMI37_29655 [Candidatus Pacearchaeota archaeon]|nr:hypothetical protein [Candidatus Pacearchaeota archaeon]